MSLSSGDIIRAVIDAFLAHSDESRIDLMQLIFDDLLNQPGFEQLQNRAVHTVANKLEEMGVIKHIGNWKNGDVYYRILQRPMLLHLRDHPPTDWHTDGELVDDDTRTMITEYLSDLMCTGVSMDEAIERCVSELGYSRTVVEDIINFMVEW